MPAKFHPAFAAINDEDTWLWRYMDVPKLISLLHSKSLHFSRPDKLADPLEGRFSSRLKPEWEREFQKSITSGGVISGPTLNYTDTLERYVRSTQYVSCWCRSDIESEALWRLFATEHGVALHTTYARLRDALPDNVCVGAVMYKDYAKDGPDPNNALGLVATKRNVFEHEREVRLVTSLVPLPKKGNVVDYSAMPKFLTVPIEWSAINRIVVSPYAPEWWVRVVRDLVKTYACPIPVEDSSMRSD